MFSVLLRVQGRHNHNKSFVSANYCLELHVVITSNYYHWEYQILIKLFHVSWCVNWVWFRDACWGGNNKTCSCKLVDVSSQFKLNGLIRDVDLDLEVDLVYNNNHRTLWHESICPHPPSRGPNMPSSLVGLMNISPMYTGTQFRLLLWVESWRG